MKTLAIIGSTGSIGQSALNVFEKNKKKFKLIFLSANTNYKKLKYQKNKYKPSKIFLLKNNNNSLISNKYEVEDLNKTFKIKKKIDYIISGVSGYNSISINLNLLKIAKHLLIANKETIICGGKFFFNTAKRNKCKIIPIDSEHYCLDYFIKNFKNIDDVKKFYIMASGGPFFEKPLLKNYKISEVTNHPTWKMGQEISINSSNFSNKVLELFEAKLLFNMPNKKLGIKVDRTSNIHALIKLNNNFYFPILHKPNMEVTISDALSVSQNYDIDFDNINFNLLTPNTKKFPLINLGYKILFKYGHIGMIFFTVFNSKLVNLYLKRKIKYSDISNTLVKAFNNKNILRYLKNKIQSIKDVYKMIKIAEEIKL